MTKENNTNEKVQSAREEAIEYFRNFYAQFPTVEKIKKILE